MPDWTEQLPFGLGDIFRQKKPVLTRLAEIFDPQDLRWGISPLEHGDWFCPFCAKVVPAPDWGGDPALVLETPSIRAHLETCRETGRPDRPPQLRSREHLLDEVALLRLAEWPCYKVAADDGNWVCPHCLQKTAILFRTWDGSAAPLDWIRRDILAHLRDCPAYQKAPLAPHSDLEVRAGLGARVATQDLLARVINEPVFHVFTDSGAWVDPFSEKPVDEINRLHTPWGQQLQQRIVEYLLSERCRGREADWRASMTAEDLIRTAGRLSAERDGKLSNGSALAHDLRAARAVQFKMLPNRKPDIAGYDIAFYYRPCEILGGDMFHFLEAGEDRTGFLVADVSGHGVEAAMIMSATMKSFSLRGRHQPSPAAVLSAVNRDLIGDMPPGRFVSAFYAILDHDTGFLRCARAGHNPAYLVPQAGDLLELAGKGLALGLCKPGVFETKIEEYQVELPPGGLLALYTDGIVESQNEERQEFGATRFQQILRDNAALSARQLTEVVVEALRRHAMSRVPDDDHTLVLIRHLA